MERINNMKDNTPFKVSIEHWGTKITIERDRLDITWDEYVELLKNVSRAAGWGEKNINELFGS